MLSLHILKLFYYGINVTCLMLVNNRSPIFHVPFIKRDELFHIRAVHSKMWNVLLQM
jgi:hypothetical protein